MHDGAAPEHHLLAANHRPSSVEKLIARCELIRARKGELLLRLGEEPRSVLVILSGGVRVSLQADNTVESKPRASSAEVGYLESGDWLGALLCFKRSRSRFAFRVATPQGLVARVIPAELFRGKVCPLMPQNYWDREADTEAQWAQAADDAMHAAETRLREAVAQERRGNFAKRQHYHIPDNLRVRCCPDLSASAAATWRQDPPPPVAEPTIQEIQRELRRQRMTMKGPGEAEVESESSSDSELPLIGDPSYNVREGRRGAFDGLGLVALLDLQERGGTTKKKQPQVEAKAKAKGKAKAKAKAGDKFSDWKPLYYPRRLPLEKWVESQEYDVMHHVPVLRPDMFASDMFSEADLLSRKRKAVVLNCLRQIRIALKSGIRVFNGVPVNDAMTLFHALDRDGNGSLDASELAEVLMRFMPGISESDAEDVTKAIDSDGDHLIQVDELVRAIEHPKALFNSSPTPSKSHSVVTESLSLTLRSSPSVLDEPEVDQGVFYAMKQVLHEYARADDEETTSRPASAGRPNEFKPDMPTAPKQKAMQGRQRPRSSNAHNNSRQRHAAGAAESASFRAWREGTVRLNLAC
eukprot:TRINITY_DN8900_c0_g1_i1.p1 TRINITY_DN8900_c0_g1~~TRINITY_DN8900_c0_g1_i1.p1  ORF type:complete len:581 (-),score=90.18 TRINITY_DN8900_c0_g1_i1:55-1797(-)